jgi:hypothetical protein
MTKRGPAVCLIPEREIKHAENGVVFHFEPETVANGIISGNLALVGGSAHAAGLEVVFAGGEG